MPIGDSVQVGGSVQIGPSVHSEALVQIDSTGVIRGEPEGADGQGIGNLFSLAKTPIHLEHLKEDLIKYPNRQAAEELANGFEFGFPLHYTGPRLPQEAKNLKTVFEHPEIVREKLNTELQHGRICGPFNNRPISTLRVSPIGLVEKKTPGDYRLIHHLSYPEGGSVNDFIDPELCSVQYTSFDEAIHMVQDMGQGCSLGKSDIKSAFRLLPVSPADFDQLGFKFENKYYFDKSMPFGCSLSCKTFEQLSTFIEYLVKQETPCGNLKHYVDDFLFAGKSQTDECSIIMKCFFKCSERLGVPIALDKTEWPCTTIVFLGLEIDSVEMVVRMPKKKVCEIIEKIRAVISEKKATLKTMQQLIGVLNFATRVIAPGRPFLRRLINSTCGLSKPYHHLRVTAGMRHDLNMWLEFFTNFNGVSVFHDRFWVSNEDVKLFTDSAAGEGLGFGALFNNKWAYGVWPASWHTSGITDDITVLEMFPIWVSLVIWGQHLQNKKILFHCDNQAVVHILNTMTSKSDRVMVLVRALTLQCLKHNMVLKSTHISGKLNSLTDSLSRLQVQRFRGLAPHAEEQPELVPSHLWRIFD